MPALLQYELGVIGEKTVARALAGIERRLGQHQARVNKALGGNARTSSGGGAGGVLAQAKRESQTLEREQRKQQAYWDKAHRKSVDARIRDDNRAHQAKVRNLEKEKRIAERNAATQMKSRKRFAENTFGAAGRSVSGTLKGVGTMAGASLGLAGGFAAAGAVQTQQREAALASKLANQAGDPGSKAQLLKESRNVKGFTGEETLGAMEGFVTKTGDLTAARAAINDLSQLALATGTDFGEMGEAAGQAFNVIRDTIKDPKEQMAALNDVMRTFAAQGSLGAVEIKDMATEIAGLGAATRKFQGGPTELLKTMGAMAQAAVARGGASSAAEATTAVTRFAADITKSPGQKALNAAGINVFADKGQTQLKSPQEVMLDILEKTKGNMPQIEEILNAESAKALAGFSPLYLEAEKNKKGSGRDAVMAEFKKFTGATVTDQQIKERAGSRLNDSDLQFKEVMKDFNTRVGTELLPVITRLIPAFTKLLPYIERAATLFGKLAESFAQDPIGGVAKIVAAKLALDMAMSSVSSAGKRLAGALTEATSKLPGVGGDGKDGGMGKLGAAGLGVQLGISAATVILTAGIVNFEKREAEINDAGRTTAAALESKDPEAVRAAREKVEKTLETNKAGGWFDNTVGWAVGDLTMGLDHAAETMGFEGFQGDPVTAGKNAANSITNQETAVKSLEANSEALRKHEAALDRLGTKLSSAGVSGPNRTDAPSDPVKSTRK